MSIVLMREERDCHNAAIATACEVDYEEASRATNHRKLGGLESPIFSNPWNMYRALIRLGFWKKNINWHNILSGRYEPMKTIALVKNSLLEQHWIVLGARKVSLSGSASFQCYWGNSIEPVLLHEDKLKQLFLSHWPNCAFQVYKANVFRVWFERAKKFFGL